MSFDESRDALKRFESTVATPAPTQVVEEDDDDDSQDDEGQYITLKYSSYILGKQTPLHVGLKSLDNFKCPTMHINVVTVHVAILLIFPFLQMSQCSFSMLAP